MALTGQAKKDYQRAYMRHRRSNKRSNRSNANVRPSMQERVGSVRPKNVRPTKLFKEACITCEHLCDGGNDAAACDTEVCPHASRGMERMGFKRSKPEYARPEPKTLQDVEKQSYNPMMVGYVPPI